MSSERVVFEVKGLKPVGNHGIKEVLLSIECLSIDEAKLVFERMFGTRYDATHITEIRQYREKAE